MDICRSRRPRVGYREGSKWLCFAKTRGKAPKSGPTIVGEIFGLIADNDRQESIAEAGIDFDFHRIRFNACDPTPHASGLSSGPTTAVGQGNTPHQGRAWLRRAGGRRTDLGQHESSDIKERREGQAKGRR
jgi:hypothetical protein